eukprot:1141935-Pelagomonas_calceolata.AAC.3
MMRPCRIAKKTVSAAAAAAAATAAHGLEYAAQDLGCCGLRAKAMIPESTKKVCGLPQKCGPRKCDPDLRLIAYSCLVTVRPTKAGGKTARARPKFRCHALLAGS